MIQVALSFRQISPRGIIRPKPSFTTRRKPCLTSASGRLLWRSSSRRKSPLNFVYGSGNNFLYLAKHLGLKTHIFCTKILEFEDLVLEKSIGKVQRLNQKTRLSGIRTFQPGDRIWIISNDINEIRTLCKKAKNNLPKRIDVFVISDLVNGNGECNGSQIQKQFPDFIFKNPTSLIQSFVNQVVPDIRRVRRFNDLLSRIKGTEKGAIIIDPDPDAIGSAIALRTLLLNYNIQINIFSVTSIDRPENLALTIFLRNQKAGKIRILKPHETINESEYDWCGIVDAQPYNPKISPFLNPSIPLRIVIDHHPIPKGKKAPQGLHWDVRPTVGSCCSILLEYLEAGKYPFQEKDPIALALYHGGRTDTNNFLRKYSPTDARAMSIVGSYIDREKLAQIEHEKIPLEYRNFLSVAIKNLNHLPNRDRVAYTFLGNISAYPDIIPTAADFLLNHFGLSQVFVAGIRENKDNGTMERYLDISARGTSPQPQLGTFLHHRLGGGGHHTTARAVIAIDQLPEKFGKISGACKRNETILYLEKLLQTLPAKRKTAA